MINNTLRKWNKKWKQSSYLDKIAIVYVPFFICAFILFRINTNILALDFFTLASLAGIVVLRWIASGEKQLYRAVRTFTVYLVVVLFIERVLSYVFLADVSDYIHALEVGENVDAVNIFKALFLQAMNRTLFIAFFAFLLFYYKDITDQFRTHTSIFRTKRPQLLKEAGIVLCIFVAGLVIRSSNLSILEPYADEYAHLTTAKALLQHSSGEVMLDGVMQDMYTRGQFVTYIVAFFFKTFEMSLFWARFPGAVIGALTSVPLYFFAKRSGRRVGLVAALLWTFSPWAVSVSRQVREYIYFDFLYVLVGMLLFVFARSLVAVILERSRKSIVTVITLLPLLALPIVYALRIDTKSTFYNVFLLYAAAGIYVLIRCLFEWHITPEKRKHWIMRAAMIGIVLYGIAVLVGSTLSIPNVSAIPKLSSYWFEVLFFKPEIYAIHNLHLLATMSLMLGGIAAVLLYRQNKSSVPLFVLLSFLVHVYAYTFHFDHYAGQRFIFAVLPWVTVLISLGASFSIGILFVHIANVPRLTKFLVWIIIIVISVNFSNIHASYAEEIEGVSPISGVFQDRFSRVLDYYDHRFEGIDSAIIASMGYAALWHLDVDTQYNAIYQYSYSDGQRVSKVHFVVFHYDKGWIFMDERRYVWGGSFPYLEDTVIGGRNVCYIEQREGFHVWNWGYGDCGVSDGLVQD